MLYRKPNLFFYRMTQLASFFVANFVFRRKMLRNEIRHRKGPFVVIANHQAAYDFVNLIGACPRPMSFVISNSFYQSLPIKGILDRIGVIPKQQFQTTTKDMRRIRAVIEAGQPLVIYPAGLMCEDGLSTPIPPATYKLFKWLGVDVYMAKTCGTYFAMPKWTKGFRSGRTTMDIYKLFDGEELKTLEYDQIRRRAEDAMLFDAYEEQEQLRFAYKNGDDIRGLEHVLYACPHCGTEFSVTAEGRNTLRCGNCGYAQTGDKLGFLHRSSDFGREIRHVSDWSRLIHDGIRDRLARGEEMVLTTGAQIQMVDTQKKRYVPVGAGRLTLNRKRFLLEGELHGEEFRLELPADGYPSLPFSPGKYLELQDGNTIYRCVLEDGRLAMKFIHVVKALYEQKQTARRPAVPV